MRIAMISEHASPLAALGGEDAGGQNTHVADLSAARALQVQPKINDIGVETLFGTSKDVVMDYANAAYKNAGMSANRYMETVTGFSASLLQGLGVANLLRDVGRIFDDLQRLAFRPDDRIVGRLDPDLAPALADALVLRGVVLTPGQLVPEHPVFRALALRRIDEHRVMLALDLGQRIAEPRARRVKGYGGVGPCRLQVELDVVGVREVTLTTLAG